jgi:hypothetical protein
MRALCVTVLIVLLPAGCVFSGDVNNNTETSAGKGEEQVDSQQELVVELCEGGDIQPAPRPWQIRVYADGLVQTRTGRKHTSPADVKRLLDRLDKLGWFAMDSSSLVEELRSAGQLRQIVEGGHGYVTLMVHRRNQVNTVSLSHPDAYTDTTVESVRRFRQALDIVRAFAK